MSFLVVAALAAGLLVAIPIAAHFLRRGQTREQVFPPAKLVRASPATLRQRRRLEDRALLGIRAAMVLALAVLGATPLVRCNRLSLTREAGASVALALVIDDSLSMRARLPGGETRWEKALSGAEDLLRSAREGDSIAIVLAGAPARMAMAATTDLGAVRRTLSELTVSDRPTDLQGAIAIGRAALKNLPQADRRVAVLSDLQARALPEGAPAVWAPLVELAEPIHDCAVLEAERQRREVRVAVACTSVEAARGRSLQLAVDDDAPVPSDGSTERPGELGTAPLMERVGEQELRIPVDSERWAMEARLSGSDAIEHDDSAPAVARVRRLVVGVVADQESASAKTGGATVIEQALYALESGATVRPLSVMPEDLTEFESLSAIIIDDPPGFSPDARSAVREFARRGGVAVALLGPRAASAQLASTLEPFARGGARWESATSLGIDASSVAWLGAEASSLDNLVRKGRTRLDGAEPAGARVRGRWEDGTAWVLEQDVGRGLLMTLGLPASIDQSDLALRPAFVALLDYLVTEARQRSGPRQTPAGTLWTFPGAERVSVHGPTGPLVVKRASASGCLEEDSTDPECGASAILGTTPELRGRYSVIVDGEKHERVATITADELLTPPLKPPPEVTATRASSEQGYVDVSREIALFLLLLFSAEMGLRAVQRARRQRARRSVPPKGPAPGPREGTPGGLSNDPRAVP